MKKWTLTAIACLAGLLLATGIAYAEEWQGKAETKTAGGLRIELITPADGVKMGENNVAVRLSDAASGQPVVRESLRMDFLMDESDTSMNHGGMSSQKPVVVDLEPVKDAPGRYEGKADLAYSGDWRARVYADSRGLLAPVSFKVSVASGGPNLLVIGGIAALIVAATAAAVVARGRGANAEAASEQAVEATKA